MNRISSAVWLAIAFACGSAIAGNEIRWAPDLESAKNASAKFKVPVLVHFYGDNCLPCEIVEKRVYTRPELVDTLNKYFICVRINATQDRDTAKSFQVHSWPTDVFLSPDGSTLYQGVCKQDLTSYLGILHNVAVMNRDRNALQTASNVASNPQPTQTVAYGADSNQAHNMTQLAGRSNSGELANYGSNYASSAVQTHSSPQAAYAEQSRQLATNFGQPSLDRSTVKTGPVDAAGQPQAITGASAFQPNTQASATNVASQAINQASYDRRSQFTAGVPTTPSGTLPRATGPLSGQNKMATYQGVPHTGPVIETANEAQTPSTATAAGSVVKNPYSVRATLASNSSTARAILPSAQSVVNNNVTTENIPAVQNNPAQYTTQYTAQQPTAANSTGANNTPALATATTSPTGNATQASAVAFQPRTAPKATVVASKPAMRGYCVIKAKQGMWLKGKPEFAVRHRGQTYWMSDETSKQQFLTAPDKAAPLLSGYDPMILLAEGRLVPGSIDFTLHERVTDQLLLFSSAESKAKYFPSGDQSTFDKNTRAIQALLK